MEELKKLLAEKYPTINFDKEKELITSGILDSMAVVDLISELEEAFGITVTMEYIQPKYVESIDAMWEMIEELQ